ncbi:MAG: AraC family transcriptional regulator [Firmicutes bacterium]|nr:AraC family transcriptional regulator [Bacillota bacterium]
MDDLKSRVAYLKGLTEGLGFNDDSREGKLFRHIIDVIDELAESVMVLQEDVEDLVDYTEAIDEDLNDLEDDYYDLEDDEFDEDEEGVFSIECPDCHELVYIDDEMLEDDDVVEILCPNCQRVVFVNDHEDFSDDYDFVEDKESEEAEL